MSDTHIRTANYVSIKKAYLDDVVLPVLTGIKETNAVDTQFFSVGGRSLCFKFYSPVLAEQLTQALAHLRLAATATPDLTVHLWDAVATQTSFVPPWHDSTHAFQSETNTKTSTLEDFLGVYLHGEESLTLYDRTLHTGYFWVHDAKNLPAWVSAAPLRTLLHWFLSESNIHLVHGAVVAHGQNAGLLTAKGGSGKSTTALACVKHGMTYLGDDYVGIEAGPMLTTHSLYNSVKVASPEHPGEKTTSFLSANFPKQLTTQAPLKAIFIPVIKHREKTIIIPTTKTEALLALVPTTLFQLPLAASNKAEVLTQIIQRLPCYRVELSSDPTEVATVIDTFLATI